MINKAIIVSGYFNPLHKGHIEYFKKAKLLADKLYVIVNNDYQRKLKNSLEFMLEDERMLIVKELEIVDKVYLSIDNDSSVCQTISKIFKESKENYKLCFGNGGDQSKKTSPETDLCNILGIEIIEGLGEKIQSSSWLLKNKNNFEN
jgi:cytidyltransferase-like protein|tara:strand:- start:30 stop:470 length:441 start_codon:yes stop_codon:yes gene_type:complete